MELKDLLMFDEENHTYYIFGKKPIVIPSVTQLLKYVRVIGDYEIPMHYAERGTEVHDLSEKIDAGQFDWGMCSEVAKPYLYSYFNFKKENNIILNSSEERVFHNRLFYAGTLDRRWTLNGVDTITDLKTGNHAGWHSLQLGAYHAAKGVADTVAVSNVYLTPEGYKIRMWDKAELKSALESIEHIAAVYWLGHKRDYDQLQNLALELISQGTEEKEKKEDDFFFEG